jgi:hypothetical protein
MTVNKIVFIHVPKSGGTSLVEMCKDQIGGSFYVGYAPDLSGDETFVAGHLKFPQVEAYLDDIFSFTFVRHPVDRLLSIYRFWKSHTDGYIDRHPGAFLECRLAKELKFKDFICDERTLEFTDNTLVRIFTSLGIGNQRVTQEHFENALDNLRRLNFVGFYDDFETSCDALFARLDLDKPALRHENNLDARIFEGDPELEWTARIDVNELDLASREVLASLTSFDEMLYSCLLDGKN